MGVKELETEHGALQYEIAEGKATIAGFRGKDLELVIPEWIEGCPVARIGKKAFLSNKNIRQITLPGGTEEIGDWAFAYCAGLKKIILPYRPMKIGQGIFKECFRLEQIAGAESADDMQEKTGAVEYGVGMEELEASGNGGETKQGRTAKQRLVDTAYLLAAAVTRLDAFYLFDFQNAGSDSWLAHWDNVMQERMEREDAEGFSKMLLCGEEDYGSKENNLDYYVEQQRRGKVRLAMLRLMHDYKLEESVRKQLQNYLLSHAKGQASEETWQVVLEEHGDEREYYQFLMDCGCVTEENFEGMMEDMGESHTEMKAFLMKYHAGHFQKEDAFAAFAL